MKESDITMRRAASGETNLLVYCDNIQTRPSNSALDAGEQQLYKDLCLLLHSRLSSLCTWRSGQTLRIHDDGKCTFNTAGKNGGPDIEISIRDDNKGIVISSTVFGRTNHLGANDDVISSAGGGRGKERKYEHSEDIILAHDEDDAVQYNVE
jgi:hypothetical protein